MIAPILLALWLVVAQAPAPICRVTDVGTSDMSGIYESADMNVLLTRCGVARVRWRNDFGDHEAYYRSISRNVRGGGVLFTGVVPDPIWRGYMDNTSVLGLRPAEPGWVLLDTLSPDAQEGIASYRLFKWEDL